MRLAKRQGFLTYMVRFVVMLTILVSTSGCSSSACDCSESCPDCPSITCSNESIPYLEKMPYMYTFDYGILSDTTDWDLDGMNYITRQVTLIKNFDKSKGLFKVRHYYRTLEKEGVKTASHVLNPSQAEEFVTTFDTDFGEDVKVRTEVIPPQVERERNIIRLKTREICTLD